MYLFNYDLVSKARLLAAAFILFFFSTCRQVNAQSGWECMTPDLLDVKVISQTKAVAVGRQGRISLIGIEDGSVEHQIVSPKITFNSVHFVDSLTGWAAGKSTKGVLYKTIDGGKTWFPCSVDYTSFAQSVYFINRNIGWLYGGTELLRSFDGGFTWNRIPLNPANKFIRMTFLDSLNGWASGVAGWVYKTNDGGNTWSSTKLPVNCLFRRIQFVDYQTGWLTGDSGNVFKTLDGGLTWTKHPFLSNWPAPGSYFLNGSEGWIASSYPGRIFKTIDGGQTWNPVSLSWNSYPEGVAFKNAHVGIVVGMNGNIYRTSDGGNSWQVVSLRTSSYRNYGIHFFNRKKGWIAGYYGELSRTDDGGKTWRVQPYADSLVNNRINSLFFLDSLRGWAVGPDNFLLRTTDGGNNWIVSHPFQGNCWLTGLFFADSLTGWIGGTQALGTHSLILKTTDGGQTWNQQIIGSPLAVTRFWFLSTTKGFATAGAGKILKTIDGGTNWFYQNLPSSGTIGSFWFIDSLTGWISGSEGAILKTTDGGETWVPQQSGVSQAVMVRFVNSQVGFAIGNKTFEGEAFILKTLDGGNHWFMHNSGIGASFQNCFFIDEQNGFIASSKIYKTTTGGDTCSIQPNIQHDAPPIIPGSEGLWLTSNYTSGNQWYFNGSAITGADGQAFLAEEQGNYLLHVTDSMGCSAFSEPVYVLNVLPRFFVNQPRNQLVGPGGTARFSVGIQGPDLALQWQMDDGFGFQDIPETSQTSGTNGLLLTIDSCPDTWEGRKFRCIAALYGFRDTSAVAGLSVNTTVAHSIRSSSLTVYPNPTEGIIRVESPRPSGRRTLFNSLGQPCYFQTIDSSTLDLKGLPRGVYLLKEETDHETIVKRIVLSLASK